MELQNSIEFLELPIQGKDLIRVEAGGSIGTWSWRTLYVRQRNIDLSKESQGTVRDF